MSALLNRLRATIESCKSSRLDLTEKEEKWYSSVWNYDGSEPEEGSVSFDGVPIFERLREMLWISRDKTISGEYILGKPPKKPGGSFIFDESWKTYLFAVMALTLVEFAAGSNSEGGWQSESETTSNKWRKILLWAATVLVAFLYLLYRFGQQCLHQERFEYAVDVLIKRLEIDPRRKSSLRTVLWERYNDDNCFWLEKNPRRRIARYFEGIESEIRDFSAARSCKPNEIVLTLFNLTDAQKTAVPDKIKRDLHIQRFIKHGTWGSNLNSVLVANLTTNLTRNTG